MDAKCDNIQCSADQIILEVPNVSYQTTFHEALDVNL